MEGGSAGAAASKAFEDAEEQMDQEGADGLRGDPFAGMTGERMDLDLLNKETGLMDCQYRFLSIAVLGLTSLNSGL
jgi:hypothetical protein